MLISTHNKKITKLEIKDIAGIKSTLDLKLNERINILCSFSGTCVAAILRHISQLFSKDFETLITSDIDFSDVEGWLTNKYLYSKHNVFTKEPKITAENFSGVILVDEIDLHWHPMWQNEIIKSLKAVFPQAQIIVTTHSPHIIQNAEPNEVIPLVINDSGDVVVNNIETGKYGFQGWTIEEILQDVMGMKDTRSSLCLNTIKSFDKALDRGDDKTALEKYEILKEMLHPSSDLRKIFEIQMVGVKKDHG